MTKKEKIIKINSLICRTLSIIAWIVILTDWICYIIYAGGLKHFFDYVVYPDWTLTYVCYGIVALGIIARLFVPQLVKILYDEKTE